MGGAARAVIMILAGIVGGVAIGLGIGKFVPLPVENGQRTAAAPEKLTESPKPGSGGEALPQIAPAAARPAATATQPTRTEWRMASMFGSDLPLLGTLGKRLTREIEMVSEGGLRITFAEPGELVPPRRSFDAVATGKIDAAWGAAAYWVDRIPAAQWFATVPFGPDATEYVAWLESGGGQALWDEIYAKYGVKALACGVAPPEGAGWFRQPVNTVEDLRGLRMRFYGMGAVVMEKLGVATQELESKDIYAAIRDGRIDAAEFSIPAIDAKLGLAPVAGTYYFPGWHQQAMIIEFLVNKRAFEALSPAQRRELSTACRDNVALSLIEGEALQSEGLRTLKAQGVDMRPWPPKIGTALEEAWREVADSFAAKDPDFKRVAASLTEFRKTYKPSKKTAPAK